MRPCHPAGEASPVHKYAFTRIYTFRSDERTETIGSVAQLHGENIELVSPLSSLKPVQQKKKKKNQERT